MENNNMWLINRKTPVAPAKRKKAARQRFGIQTVLRLPATPSILKNERGMALVTALVMGLVGMLMTGSLLYMTKTGIWTSGSKARYQTALEAAHGSLVFFAKENIQKGVGGDTLGSMGTYGGVLTPQITDADFTTKLTTTGTLGDGTYPAAPLDTTMTLTFAANPNIIVDTTIVSTSRGNSKGGGANLLISGGVVENNSGKLSPQHVPYLYQIEVLARNVNAPENARLSAIYAY